jgi:adenylosuccinate lyase
MESVWSDKRKFQSWLDTEIAILEAKEELRQIPTGIALKTKQNAKFTVKAIEEREKETRHDLMAFVQVVSESLPLEIRPYFHAGVTSYDIEDTALATQIRDSTDLIEIELSELSQTLKEMAQKYKYTLEIGRTHGVHAEPITFGLKLLNWYAEVERHRKKLMENRPYFLVGKISGAVGTYANIDPRIEQIVCKKLGIYPADISTQIVSRDCHSLYLFLLASIAASLEKFATEIRNLHRTEIKEVQEPSSEKQKGSSAMPHKKALPNPISSENVSSLSRLIKGYLIVALENQALCWHERTLDNSANERIIFADASTYVHYLLWRFINVLKNLKINPEKMQENLNLTRGIIFSEDVMLALAEKGMSREDAHALLQELTLRSWEQGLEFKEVLLADLRITNILSKEEIDNCLDPQRHLKNIDQIFAQFGL